MKNIFEKIRAFVLSHKKAVIAVVAIIVIAAGSVFTINVIIPKNDFYYAGKQWLSMNDYSDAIYAFYKADWWLGGKAKSQAIQEAHPEDTPLLTEEIPLRFGKYEQDNNTQNGPEDIEWIVYEKDGSKLLLVSKYALDVVPFNDELEDVTWETCSLRKWLNEDFLNTAFTEEEIDKIMISELKADSNLTFGTSGGNDTNDKVFILNYTEYMSYPPFDIIHTEYVRSKGAFIGSVSGCVAWLRTPSKTNSSYEFVLSTGDYPEQAEESGFEVNATDVCVRPAIWVDFSS